MKGCFLAPFLVLNFIHGHEIDFETAIQKDLKKSTSFKLPNKDEHFAGFLENGRLPTHVEEILNSRIPVGLLSKVQTYLKKHKVFILSLLFKINSL